MDPDRIRHWIDLEYSRDVRDYQALFSSVDRHDPASLRTWFEAHPYLSPNDLARIADVSLRTVRRWKEAAGLPPAPRKRPVTRSPRAPVTPAVPAISRDRSRLAELYPGHSIRQIARAVGRSYTAVRRALKRRGVAFLPAGQASRSGHPSRTLAWLFQHYAARGLSLTRCARLAGVSRSTMSGWLLAHRLRVRSNAEQQLLNYRGSHPDRVLPV
jgi:transposase